MNREDRITAIAEFMATFPDNISPRPISSGLWQHMIALTDGGDTHRPFGFSASAYFPYDDKWCFFYSSDVMADVTAELDDAEFQEWLRYVRAHVNAHASLDTQDEAEVDQAVYAVLPEARDLLAKVHNHYFSF